MTQGPELPQPIYPDGQRPSAGGKPGPGGTSPGQPVDAGQIPAPVTPRGPGGGAPLKLLLIGLAAVVAIVAAGFGLATVLGDGDDPDKDTASNGEERTTDAGEASEEARTTAAEALSSFPQEAQDCLAGALDEDPELRDQLAIEVQSEYGSRFDDSEMARAYADAMAGCVELDDVVDQLASEVPDPEQAACVRENAGAWSDEDLHTFIRNSVDSTMISTHSDAVQELMTC